MTSKEGERIARLEVKIDSQQAEIQKMQVALHGRLKNEITHVKESFNTDIAQIKEQQKSNMVEIQALRAWKNWVLGAGAAVGAFVSLGGAELWKKFISS